MQTNPFHDLYLSEAISEDALVQIFSPIIVDLTGTVFEPGNVIVRGLQGTGKTMLLNLLRPESRLAYLKANIPFPVSDEAGKYIGAGVNLRKCGALEFAQHILPDTDERTVQELELLFADFLNYWITLDLIATLMKLARAANTDLASKLGISLKADRLSAFAQSFSEDDCWFGAHPKATDLNGLQKSITTRINTYRRFLNLNLDALPEQVLKTKTVIGDPVIKAAEKLRFTGVIEDSTKVFIRIDQYEQLKTLNVSGSRFGDGCRDLIHKALAARDGRISYRIGTRSNGWPQRPKIYRTNDALELKRDFSVVDMDEIFRRRENVRTWRFPAFAEDIFARRLKAANIPFREGSQKVSLQNSLQKSENPKHRAARYVRKTSGTDIIEREIRSISEVGSEWQDYVRRLAGESILDGWLACAWLRQRLAASKKSGERFALDLPKDEKPIWKKYWYKERVAHALMQIASANRQALIWSGEEEVLNLSGGQILVFLFVMQHIWDAALREGRRSHTGVIDFPIEFAVQGQGILEASYEWRNKQIEGSSARQRRTFIDALGAYLFNNMIDDKSMSYPGANGFSLREDSIQKDEEVDKLLRESVGYGDLYSAPHTSKTPGEKRTKYYLAPILSPVYRIPSVHTKEPEYTTTAQVRKWMEGTALANTKQAKKPLVQPSLFNSDEDD